MDWLKKLAPTLAAALGGPLAGIAVEMLGPVLGLEEPTVEKVQQALAKSQLTGEQMIALKQIEADLKIKEQELGFKFAELAQKNTADARAMQVAVRSKVPGLLSFLITVGFFGILVGMMTGKLTAQDNQALLIMLGALGAAWGAVVNYWFGSTSGSQDKTAMLARSKPAGEK